MNDDGAVDTSDKLIINRYLNDMPIKHTKEELDLNCDGRVDHVDKRVWNRFFITDFRPPPSDVWAENTEAGGHTP